MESSTHISHFVLALERLLRSAERLLRYSQVGFLGAAFSFFGYLWLNYSQFFTGPIWPAIVVKTTWLPIAYFLHFRYSFRAEGRMKWSPFVIFTLVQGVGYLTTPAVIYLLSIKLNIEDWISFLASMLVFSVSSYAFNNYLVFNRR